MAPAEPSTTDERGLARLLGTRLGTRLQGLYSVGAGVCLHPEFAPDFLPPRLEVIIATARVLGSLIPPPCDARQAAEQRRLADELYRLACGFRDLILKLSSAAPRHTTEVRDAAARLGETYQALLTTVESYLGLFLVETAFPREKEIGREVTQGLLAAVSGPAIEARP